MKNKNDITIPLELFENKFTLEEVGAICLLLSIPHITKESVDTWEKDVTLLEVIKKLTDNETITISQDENGNTVTTIHTENKMEKESGNIDVRRAMKELAKHYSFEKEELDVIREYMEDVAFESYQKGYEDSMIDYNESFTGYGKKEDF